MAGAAQWTIAEGFTNAPLHRACRIPVRQGGAREVGGAYRRAFVDTLLVGPEALRTLYSPCQGGPTWVLVVLRLLERALLDLDGDELAPAHRTADVGEGPRRRGLVAAELDGAGAERKECMMAAGGAEQRGGRGVGSRRTGADRLPPCSCRGTSGGVSACSVGVRGPTPINLPGPSTPPPARRPSSPTQGLGRRPSTNTASCNSWGSRTTRLWPDAEPRHGRVKKQVGAGTHRCDAT